MFALKISVEIWQEMLQQNSGLGRIGANPCPLTLLENNHILN